MVDSFKQARANARITRLTCMIWNWAPGELPCFPVTFNEWHFSGGSRYRKEGRLFVKSVNRDQLGGFNAGGDNQIRASLW